MAKTQKKETLTIGEILTAYEKAHGFESDSAFAEALGIPRQSLSQWLNDVHKPSVMNMRMIAISNPGTWKEEMANDVLKALGVESVHWVSREDVVLCDGGMNG